MPIILPEKLASATMPLSEGIEVLHQPAAHTDGDAIVFFRRSDVLVAGDVLDTNRFPIVDVARGGTINGEIAALNRLVDIAIPSVPIVSRDAGTLVIAGHGRVCDQYDVAEYRDMVTIVRDRVRDLKKAGMTLAQVKAAAPARIPRPLPSLPTWSTSPPGVTCCRSACRPRRSKTCPVRRWNGIAAPITFV